MSNVDYILKFLYHFVERPGLRGAHFQVNVHDLFSTDPWY
jgi:hypothetical protein